MGEEYPEFDGDLPKYIGEVVRRRMTDKGLTAIAIANQNFNRMKMYKVMGYKSAHCLVTTFNHLRNGRMGVIPDLEQILSLVFYALKFEEDHEAVILYKNNCKEKGREFFYPPKEINISEKVAGDVYRVRGYKKGGEKTAKKKKKEV